MEGILGDRTFKSFQDLKRYKAGNFKEPPFVDELCRGIAVNTSYSSSIQVGTVISDFMTHCMGALIQSR